MNKFLFGIGIGYIIGTLFAPKKGSELRSGLISTFESTTTQVRDGGKELLNGAIEQSEQMRDEVKGRYDKMKQNLETAKDLAEQSVNKVVEGAQQLTTSDSSGAS